MPNVEYNTRNDKKKTYYLHGFNDLEIGDTFQFGMFRCMIVLLRYHDSLLEEVLVDSYAILFWHQHSVSDDKFNDLH